MKKLIVLFLSVLFIFSCTETKVKSNDLLISEFKLKLLDGTEKHIKTKSDLESFTVSYLSNDDDTKITDLIYAKLELIEGERSDFYIIKVSGLGINDVVRNIAIPLDGSLDMGVSRRIPTMSISGCSHYCDVGVMMGCSSSCDLVVHEPCARQSCSCKSGGTGGCSGGIRF